MVLERTPLHPHPSLRPVLAPPPCHCSDSNSDCLCFCSGKYNQSISHWQIPIICNFMGDKPIWNQNDPPNVCMQLPQWANYDFIYLFIFYLLSWNPGDKCLFLGMELGSETRESQCERATMAERESGFVTKKGFVWGRGFWHTCYSAAPICSNIQSVSNC